MNRRKSESYPL